MNTSRTEQAKAYLVAQRGRWPAFAREAGVGYQWILKFANGHISEPGASKVDAILAHRDTRQESAA